MRPTWRVPQAQLVARTAGATACHRVRLAAMLLPVRTMNIHCSIIVILATVVHVLVRTGHGTGTGTYVDLQLQYNRHRHRLRLPDLKWYNAIVALPTRYCTTTVSAIAVEANIGNCLIVEELLYYYS